MSNIPLIVLSVWMAPFMLFVDCTAGCGGRLAGVEEICVFCGMFCVRIAAVGWHKTVG